MYIAASVVKPACLRASSRSGRSPGNQNLATLPQVLNAPGFLHRRRNFAPRATAADSGTGIDFGSLFSDALSSSSLSKSPSEPLPDASVNTRAETVTTDSTKPDLGQPQPSGDPRIAAQAPADPPPSQPIQQASELLSKSDDLLSSSIPSTTTTLPGADKTSPEAAVSTSDTEQVSDSAASVTDSVQSAANDVASSVQDTVSDIFDSGSAAASSALAAADEATAGLRSAADGSLAAAQNTADSLLSSAYGAREGAGEGLTQLTSELSNSASQASAAAADIVGRLFDQLPLPVQTALSQVGDAVSQAATQAATFANDNPSGAAAVALPVILGAPVTLWLTNLLTSYSGNKTAEEVLELLETSDTVLVDIRPEADRRRKGVPLLEGGAFGKGAVVPRMELGSSASKLRNASDIQADAAAAVIAQLSKVRKRRTMVVLMDNGDNSAVPIAKRLLTFGILNSCVIRGGFRSWAQSGMPMTASSDNDYTVSPLQLLGARTSFAANQTARSPLSLTAGATSVALAVGALVDWHRTLQFIGVTGILLTLINRATQYESPQDFIDDLSIAATTVVRPVSAVAGTVAKVVTPAQKSRRSADMDGGFKEVAVEIQDVASDVASGSPIGPNTATRD